MRWLSILGVLSLIPPWAPMQSELPGEKGGLPQQPSSPSPKPEDGKWAADGSHVRVKGGTLWCGPAGERIKCNNSDGGKVDFHPATAQDTVADMGPSIAEPAVQGDDPSTDPSTGRRSAGSNSHSGRVAPPPPPPPSGAEVASWIAQRMPIPEPRIGVAPKPHTWFVNIAGWVWAEDGWKHYSTTHTIRGRTATVVAQPVEMTFWPGDGNAPTRCTGPGERWFDGQSNTAPGRCAHT